MADEKTRVLLVDDETDFLATLSRRLTVRDFDVRTAENGRLALDVLQAHAVDVVVMDVKMPGMDGIQAVREIRKAHPLVEIILLTGHADLEASMEGLALGAFDYLLKPVAIDELVYKIQDAHEAKRLREKKIDRLKREALVTKK